MKNTLNGQIKPLGTGCRATGGGRLDEVLFEEWPLNHPGEQMFASLGGNHILENPRLKNMLPFCGEYQGEQANLRVTIAIEDGELVLSDGTGLQTSLDMSKKGERVYEKTSACSIALPLNQKMVASILGSACISMTAVGLFLIV